MPRLQRNQRGSRTTYSIRGERKRLLQELQQEATRICHYIATRSHLGIKEAGYSVDPGRDLMEIFLFVDASTAGAFDRATLHRLSESGAGHLEIREDREKHAGTLLRSVGKMNAARIDIRLVSEWHGHLETEVHIGSPEPPTEPVAPPWQGPSSLSSQR